MKARTDQKAGITFHTIPGVPWQYPVITEKAAFETLYNTPDKIQADYFAFPWATLLDMPPDKASLLGLPVPGEGATVFTVCQHIRYMELCPVMEKIGINVCFASHATNEGVRHFGSHGIKLYPFPLYPVNAPQPVREKDLVYSFIGMEYRSDHLSDIRDRIVRMEHPSDAYVKIRSGWHYDNRVYKEQVRNSHMTTDEIKAEQTNTREFMDILGRSRYSLCPAGTGPNNIRFWESLGAGSIPLLLSDRMLLPEYNWDSCILRIPESNLESLPDILGSISRDREADMREGCLRAFRDFSGENFSATVRDVLGKPGSGTSLHA